MGIGDVAYVMVLKTPPWYLAGGQSADDVDWAFSPVDAADLESSYVDLVGKATIEVVAAPTLSDDGWAFDGTQFLRVSTAITQAHTVLVQFSGLAAANACICGCDSQGAGWDCTHNLWGRYNSSYVRYAVDGSAQSKSPVLYAGNLGLAGPLCFRNGVFEHDQGGLTEFGGTVKYGIGGLAEWNTNPISRITGTVRRIVKYNITLSEAQMGLVAARMAA